MSITGHSTTDMVDRYSHYSAGLVLKKLERGQDAEALLAEIGFLSNQFRAVGGDPAKLAELLRHRLANGPSTINEKLSRPRSSGVVAIRVAENGAREVLLITSRETRRWVVPKGWPMKGRKPWEAAAQEALEEAGVVGRPRKKPAGTYTDVRARKTRPSSSQIARRCMKPASRHQKCVRWDIRPAVAIPAFG